MLFQENMTDCQKPKLCERCGLEKTHWQDKCPVTLERGEGGRQGRQKMTSGLNLNHSGNFNQGPGLDEGLIDHNPETVTVVAWDHIYFPVGWKLP